MQQATEVWRT